MTVPVNLKYSILQNIIKNTFFSSNKWSLLINPTAGETNDLRSLLDLGHLRKEYLRILHVYVVLLLKMHSTFAQQKSNT